MRELYPEIEPFDEGFLKVSDLHTVHYEQVGNPKGKKAIFFHGGPGGGLDPDYRRYFDPKRWHVTLFDQRGSGKSTPHAELRENTTWDLVRDAERLREHLKIDKWLVFGGSWGSTLGLAYAETHPERCTGLVLRGIFLLRRKELLWFYQEGASWLFPDAWEEYLKPIPEVERGDMMGAYYRRLTSEDQAVRSEAAKAWSIWEGSTSKLYPDPDLIAHFAGDAFADAFARIECHYFVNGAFLRSDTPAPRRRPEDRAPARRDRAGPLRRGVPGGERLGAAQALAEVEARDRARLGPQHEGARDPQRAGAGDRRLRRLSEASGGGLPRDAPLLGAGGAQRRRGRAGARPRDRGGGLLASGLPARARTLPRERGGSRGPGPGLLREQRSRRAGSRATSRRAGASAATCSRACRPSSPTSGATGEGSSAAGD